MNGSVSYEGISYFFQSLDLKYRLGADDGRANTKTRHAIRGAEDKLFQLIPPGNLHTGGQGGVQKGSD